MESATCVLPHGKSRFMEVTRLVNLENTMSRENATHGKKYFHEGIQQVTCEIRRGEMCKNEVVIERYCPTATHNHCSDYHKLQGHKNNLYESILCSSFIDMFIECGFEV